MNGETRIEFFVEPFEEGRPGPHVMAAIEAVEAEGLTVDVAPFSNTALGSTAAIARAAARLVERATEAGASRISIQISGGETAPGLHVGKLHDALDQMIEHVESVLGESLGNMSRDEKQAAVRMLDQRGAFLLRRSIEDVADRMGVSRITIYNYLNAIREIDEES